MTIVALVALSLAVIAVICLVVNEMVGAVAGIVVPGLVALVIGVFWWVLPLRAKKRGQT